MDLTNPQVTLRQARIEELEAELAKERGRVKELERRNVGFSGLTNLMQTSLEGDTARIGELLDELAAAQATIAEMRECFDACRQLCAYPEDVCKIAKSALALPACIDALLEARALECERLVFIKKQCGDPYKWLEVEAAAHRARKEGK